MENAFEALYGDRFMKDRLNPQLAKKMIHIFVNGCYKRKDMYF